MENKNANQITIHRALAKLKTIAGRINDLRREGYVFSVKTTDKTVQGQSLENATKSVKSNFDELMDLLTLEDTIKSKIAISNATTMVTIGSESMTVVEAISRKNTLETKQNVLSTLRSQLYGARESVENSNRALSNNVEKQIAALFSNKDSADVEAINNMRDTLTKQQSMSLFDPANVLNHIDKMAKDLALFQEEVDAVLSESNSITYITI